MFDDFVALVREIYGTSEFVPLHEPRLGEKEKRCVQECVDSSFVSTVSEFVPRFERQLAELTGARHVVATANGTAALHVALHALGVGREDEVITQPLSFIATANAIRYCGAVPVFVDVASDSFGMDPNALKEFLEARVECSKGGTFNRSSGRRVVACLPVHTFGHPADIQAIRALCDEWGITLIEDAAEALGSHRSGVHCGTTGSCGILSFNGNKIVTTGGGGAVITNDEQLAERVRHLATTARAKHKWDIAHDELGFNYRMPGLNAALGCAQLENLPGFLEDKRAIAQHYAEWAAGTGVEFVYEPPGAVSNYWLNAFMLEDTAQRDRFLAMTNDSGVMTRPAWRLLCDLPEYVDCDRGSDLPVARDIRARLVNIPSSARSGP